MYRLLISYANPHNCVMLEFTTLIFVSYISKAYALHATPVIFRPRSAVQFTLELYTFPVSVMFPANVATCASPHYISI